MYPFDKIISVDGFCYSGSSAVIDLLKEFENTSIFSFEYHSETKTANYEQSYGELHFYKLFQFNRLRQAFLNKNFSLIDLLIKNIVLNYYRLRLNKCYLFLKSSLYQTEEFKQYTKNLLFNILELTDEDKEVINIISEFYFPVHVAHPSPLFYLKEQSTFYSKYKQKHIFSFQKDKVYFYKIKNNISIEQFDNYIVEYMKNILTTFCKKDNKSSIIVLDQFLQKLNISDEKNYLQDCKQISVIRDPRDMYYWLSRESVFFDELEIETWVNNINKDFANIQKSENRLIILLEDLVFNYEETINEICNFLGLNQKQHVKKLKYFDPEISKKSIGLWRNYPIDGVMEYINKNTILPSGFNKKSFICTAKLP